jgi:hypothetical protein
MPKAKNDANLRSKYTTSIFAEGKNLNLLTESFPNAITI